VPHTDPEILALRALGEMAGTAADVEHLARCALCEAELGRLAEVVTITRGGAAECLESPPRQVWDRIAAAIGASDPQAPGPEAVTRLDGQLPRLDGRLPRHGVRPAGRGARRGRRRIWPPGRLGAVLAGLAAGLVIGIGSTAGITQLARPPAVQVIARTELRPLPQFPQWHDAAGTAVMRASAASQVIQITLKAPPKPGFYEAWLLGRDGTSMISLGDLSASRTGTFAIPPGTNLGFYSRIDISLQPFNGRTAHSRTSVVRGSLPLATAGRSGPAT
jgi:Anti-sigma-K factor rskA